MALTLAVAAVVAGTSHVLYEHGSTSARTIAEAVFVLVLVVLLGRLHAAGIRVGPGGFDIVNPIATKHLDWTQLERVDVAPYGRWPRVAFVRSRDGRRHVAFGIRSGRGRPTEDDGLLRAVRDLNVEIEQRRDDGAPAGLADRRTRGG